MQHMELSIIVVVCYAALGGKLSSPGWNCSALLAVTEPTDMSKSCYSNVYSDRKVYA